MVLGIARKRRLGFAVHRGMRVCRSAGRAHVIIRAGPDVIRRRCHPGIVGAGVAVRPSTCWRVCNVLRIRGPERGRPALSGRGFAPGAGTFDRAGARAAGRWSGARGGARHPFRRRGRTRRTSYPYSELRAVEVVRREMEGSLPDYTVEILTQAGERIPGLGFWEVPEEAEAWAGRLRRNLGIGASGAGLGSRAQLQGDAGRTVPRAVCRRHGSVGADAARWAPRWRRIPRGAAAFPMRRARAASSSGMMPVSVHASGVGVRAPPRANPLPDENGAHLRGGNARRRPRRHNGDVRVAKPFEPRG